MSRHALPHAKLDLARDPDPAPPPGVEAAPAAAVAERKEWFFVKNMTPRETLIFLNGEKFVFPGPTFHTNDQELAEKILAVADRYRIVLQK